MYNFIEKNLGKLETAISKFVKSWKFLSPFEFEMLFYKYKQTLLSIFILKILPYAFVSLIMYRFIYDDDS